MKLTDPSCFCFVWRLKCKRDTLTVVVMGHLNFLLCPQTDFLRRRRDHIKTKRKKTAKATTTHRGPLEKKSLRKKLGT